ncbi:MAG: hypothetical protein RJB66_1459 [Pseudomonadota bacterium]|jgi:YbbR domain-containing protein
MITKRFSIEHFGYKVIAFLITLILWVTVVSQREMVANQNVMVQFVVPNDYEIVGPREFEVNVRVEGPRPILKRFLEKSWPATLIVPIRTPSLGPNSAEIPITDLQLPSAIKVLSIKPREVVLQINKLKVEPVK